MAQLDKIRLSGTTYDIIDATAIHSLDGYYTSDETNAAITAATNALAESIAEQGYQTSGDVQSAVSGKVDSDTYTAFTSSTSTALAAKFAGASWDSQSSRLYFYDNASATGTALVYVDGSDWIKDSFLKSVTIEDREISGETVPCLVFVFDTETGEEETVIPLSDIFDPSNYVDMATYTAYTAATDAALSGKVDSNTYTAYTAATDTALAGKQATLESGTNIKTINNTSVLGAGNISTLQVEVSGTTLVFS